MKCIDDFFAVREELNLAIREGDLEKIKKSFPGWVWQQCVNYSGMTEEEREQSEDIPALDQQLKMKWCWPKVFDEAASYRGILTVVTHELSRTGAPMVLLDAVRIMKENGYFVILFSPDDGALKEEFLRAGVPVILGEYIKWLDKTEENQECARFWKIWEAMVGSSDLLFCNTVVTYQVIKKFLGSEMPVIWWIHEGFMILEQVKAHLPAALSENIHPFFVSKYSQNAFWNLGFSYEHSEIMPYGIPDAGKDMQPVKPQKTKQFITVGTISKLKGQDLLVQAIEQLDAQVRENCHFLFVGKKLDEQIAKQILEAAGKYASVEYRSELDHEMLMQMIQSCDCLICPSRDDTMPVVATEAFSMGKTVICSDHTGTAEYIDSGKNGFLFQNEDREGLKQEILRVCEATAEELGEIGKQARKIFECHFTEERFEAVLNRHLENQARKRKCEFSKEEQSIGSERAFFTYQQKRLMQLNHMYQNVKADMRAQGDEAYKDSCYLHEVIKNLEEEQKRQKEKESRFEEEKKALEACRAASKRREKELEEELQKVYQSMSWKVTAPLRKAKETWKK